MTANVFSCLYFRVDPSRPNDLKESYDITLVRSEVSCYHSRFSISVDYSSIPSLLILQRLPDAEVPRFRAVVTELYEACMRLSLAILEAMGQALKLKVCKE